MLSSKIISGISMGETVSLPDILPYPKIRPIDDVKELRGQFVYIIKTYPETGLAVVIHRESDHLFIRMGDFDGNLLDPTTDEVATKIHESRGNVGSVLSRLVATSKLIGVKQALYYLSNDNGTLRLVDMRVSINKFTGPGYINDFFGKQVETQEIVRPGIILNEENLSMLCDKKEEYVVKPSRFKFTMEGEQVLPMYGKISDEADSSV